MDGLRAIAVLAVLLFHVFPSSVRGGFIGVDIFFVISGYLITGILLKEERISIRQFYVRRVRRIFPALAVVLACTLFAGWWLLLPDEYRALGKHTFAGAAFVSNLALWRESGYFDTASEMKPLLHLWSLAVEEQYYLFWPLFIAVVRRRPRVLILSMSAVFVVSAIVSVYTTRVSPAAAFYLPFSRFWELAAGGLVATFRRSTGEAGHARSNELLAATGFAAILAGFGLIDRHTAFPGLWAALPVLGTSAVIAAGSDTWLARRVLSLRVLVWVGLISYPLYLWHWPLLSFARKIVGEEAAVAVRVGLALAAVLLAFGTYRLVESPLRRRGARPRTLALCASIGAIALLGLGILRADGIGWRLTTPAIEAETLPATGPCPIALADQEGPTLCKTSRAGVPRGALVGDSHAAMLFASLSHATSEPWLLASQPACPPLADVRVESPFSDCGRRMEDVLRWLRSTDASSIRTVIVGSYFGYALTEAYAADNVSMGAAPQMIELDGHRDQENKARLFERGLDAYLSQLLDSGKQVIFVEDGPEFPFFPSRCVDGLPLRSAIRDAMIPEDGCSVSRDVTMRRRAGYVAMMRRIAARHPELRIVDMLDIVCDGARCPATRDGQLLYSDSHHLSNEGAALVVSVLLRTPARLR